MADSNTTTPQVMNDLKAAFNEIGAFEFLLNQLQRHVDEQDKQGIVDISNALLAFLPPYIQNFDDKFQVAWEQTVEPELVGIGWKDEWDE